MGGRSFTVSWAGSDPTSGAAACDVYMRPNDGARTLWQSDTTATSALWTGERGRSYAFVSIARDDAGNVEGVVAAAMLPDTKSSVSAPPGRLLNDDWSEPTDAGYTAETAQHVWWSESDSQSRKRTTKREWPRGRGAPIPCVRRQASPEIAAPRLRDLSYTGHAPIAACAAAPASLTAPVTTGDSAARPSVVPNPDPRMALFEAGLRMKE